MKIYRNLFNAVAEILQEIFRDNRYADKALERAFRQNPAWGSRDRRFIAETVYDIVRYFRLYSYLAETENNYWHITAVWLALHDYELPDWPEFRNVHPDNLQKKMLLAQKEFLLRESLPDWLNDLGAGELGKENWETEFTSMNRQAEVFLRVNTLKTNAERTRSQLAKDGLESVPVDHVENALKLTRRANIFQHKLFREGWFEVQDAGSQLISSFLDPAPGDFVIDACAGAGGKTLHLAALMENKGKIISMDVEQWKLEELKKRAKRAGAHNIETRLIQGNATITGFENRADRLLLDVPCSGLGVLRRNPDAKWKLSRSVIEKTMQIQRDILKRYSIMVRPGGHLVYSTCSILPSENREQVDHFLSNTEGFELINEKTLLPSEGFDGFYMALVRRNS